MTSDFKLEVAIGTKLRMRSEKLPKQTKSSVEWQNCPRHIGNRCRLIHFQWEIYERKYN